MIELFTKFFVWFAICFVSIIFVSQYKWNMFWNKIVHFERKYIRKNGNKLFLKKYPIWVFGRGVYALNLIKALSDKYKITLVTTDETDFAKWSRKLSDVRYTSMNDDIYEHSMENGMVIGVGEETILFEHELNKNSAENKKINMLGHSESSKFKKLYHNKANFMILLKNLNLPCLEFYKEYTPLFDYNGTYLLKPVYSRGGQGQEKLEFINKDFVVPPNHILQKYIHFAKECSTFLLADRGEIKIFLTYDVSAMVDGYGTKRVLIENNETYEYCNKIVSELDYSGFLGIDYISSEGIWYPIDFNPRITNGIGFFKENSFDPVMMKCELDIRDTISTIPYVLSTGKVFDMFKYKSDYFNIYDIIPGIVITTQLIWAIIESIYYNVNTKQYIKSKLLEKIVTCDHVV